MKAGDSSPAPQADRGRRLYVYWGIALTLLLTAGLVCWKVVGPAMQPIGTISVSPHVPSQTGYEWAGINQFYDNLRWCKTYLGGTQGYVREENWFLAMLWSTKALRHWRVAEATWRGITTKEPGWGSEYAEAVAEVKKAGSTELPRLKAQIAPLISGKRDWLRKLSPEKLVSAFIASESCTLPDSGTEVDVLAEMKVRHKAAQALLDRVRKPDDYQTFEETYSQTAAQCRTRTQVRWGVGYEVVLAEAEWLLGLAPPGQRAKCRELVGQIERGKKVVEDFFGQIEDLKTGKYGDITFADRIRSRRETAKNRLAFPEKVEVVSGDK